VPSFSAVIVKFKAVLALHWASRSMSSTRFSRKIKAPARLTAVVVLPTPPLKLASATIRVFGACEGFAFIAFILCTLSEKLQDLTVQRAVFLIRYPAEFLVEIIG